MFATILFMYTCGVVDLVLEVYLFLSYPDANVTTMLGMVILDFITVCYVPPAVHHAEC
jgi:hypothetical protein